MGAGIAHTFLIGGSRVTVVEVDDDAAEAAAERVRASIVAAEERRHLAEPPDDVLARLTTTADPGDLAAADLVVEAVPESVALKAEVLAKVQDAAPDAVLATHTSSLSIDGPAADLDHPERLLSLHCFNPVPASGLVEVVVGTRTEPALIERARGWVAALGKTAITATDSPGFASSRLGVALAIEAMRILEEGVATSEDIDSAMTLGYKHPVGPLRTTDIVGLDVRLAIAEHLASGGGAVRATRRAPPEGRRRSTRPEHRAGVLHLASGLRRRVATPDDPGVGEALTAFPG